MDMLTTIFQSIFNFFDYIWNFLNDGIYKLLVYFFAQLIEWLTIGHLEFIYWALGFAWDTAKQIIWDIGLGDLIKEAWSSINPKSLAILNWCRIPESLNMILTAYFTKFVMKFIPGL